MSYENFCDVLLKQTGYDFSSSPDEPVIPHINDSLAIFQLTLALNISSDDIARLDYDFTPQQLFRYVK